MLARVVLVFALAASGAVAAGCGAVAPTSDEAPPRRLEERASTTPPMWARQPAPPPAPCGEPTPLLVHHDEAGRVDRLHARVTARNVVGNFLVDTGSHTSFATHSGDESGSSARTVIACTTTSLPIIARMRPGTTPEGLPQGGVLGADLVAHGAVLDLDFANETLSWYQPAPAAAAGAAGAPGAATAPGTIVLPIEHRKGWLVASGIRVDGRDVKLVVDTGATNVILVGKTPRPGEVREDTVDGTTAAITLWHGHGEIAFAGGPLRDVPVDRTDDFATLEGLIANLGGDVAGLLGITALGRDRIVISRDSLVVMLPP